MTEQYLERAEKYQKRLNQKIESGFDPERARAELAAERLKEA